MRRILPALATWLVLAACLAVTAPARAEFVTSDEFHGWLLEATRSTGSFRDTTMALGYVAGVHDLFDGTEVCAPDHARGRAMLFEVRDWMERNRGKWDRRAAVTVRLALVARFPCPPPGR
jgi:hypothetical protein